MTLRSYLILNLTCKNLVMRRSRRTQRSRYFVTLRSSRLTHIAAIGALTVMPTGCGNSDTTAFGSQDTSFESLTPVETSDAMTSSSDIAIQTTAAPTTTMSSVQVSANVEISFTYSPTAEGKNENPYIAVWVEDANGELVQTIAAWYLQSPKGQRWLRDLRKWSSLSHGFATTTGATRSPGQYALLWDGKDLTGNLAEIGTYTLYIESAREKGPYSITSAQLTIGSGNSSIALPDATEIHKATAVIST